MAFNFVRNGNKNHSFIHQIFFWGYNCVWKLDLKFISTSPNRIVRGPERCRHQVYSFGKNGLCRQACLFGCRWFEYDEANGSLYGRAVWPNTAHNKKHRFFDDFTQLTDITMTILGSWMLCTGCAHSFSLQATKCTKFNLTIRDTGPSMSRFKPRKSPRQKYCATL